ncbi:Heterokaryon incompatibility protein [Pleurostoma richardsiae]|uniref:Heterokaryon incompatibility protein n=1 Tax=Pleurostoma richardsiae TaxID=41990 RepID=A0AA38SC48_9PEZI|nr:Heterokaryon incompatibility protein [Pleurostoma richardsiae]
MVGGHTKARTRRSRATPSEAVQARLLDAAADKGAEIPRVQTQVNGGLARNASPEETAKRQPDARSEGNPLPVKRSGLTRTGAQRPGVGEAVQADKTTRQHLKPTPFKHRDTSLPGPKVERQQQVPQVPRLWKRQIDGDGDDTGHQLKRARLTRKNLARFDRMVKKGMNKRSASASAPPASTADSSSTKTVSTTSSGFAVRAHRNGILDPLSSKPPVNLAEIHEQHARSRATASPPEARFKRYARTVSKAGNEATMVHVAFNRAFTAFPKNVGFNSGLSTPQPDFTEGLEMQEYDPFPVEEHVSGAVLYKDDPYSVTLPHLAGEWKGPDGKVRTFTTDGTNINFYAHYAAPEEEDGTLKYHQYQYASTNIKDTYQGHKDGRKGIRNQQDHARDQSYALKDQLKNHWKQRRRGGLQPIAEGTHLDGLVEDPLPAQDSTPLEDDGEVEELRPSPVFVEQKHTSRKAPPVCSTEDPGYEAIGRPTYAPTPPRSSEERRRSTRLSNALGESANAVAKKDKSSSRGKG